MTLMGQATPTIPRGPRPACWRSALFCLFGAAAVCFAAGCKGTQETAGDPPGTYRLSGVMHATHLEGGCWQFIAENGQTYDLAGDEIGPLLHDGLHAELLVRDASGMASICMSGKIVIVVKIISSSQ